MNKWFLLVLLLSGCVLALVIYPIRQSDYDLYEELEKSSRPEENPVSFSQQTRHQVHKHIWYQDVAPLYVGIESEDSDLFFFRQNHQMEVVEELRQVSCLMQEELYYVLPNGKEVHVLDESVKEAKPMQRIRYLEAEQAYYHYTTHLFVAEDVTFWRYQIEGHTPPDKTALVDPVIQAVAQSVEFTLQGDQPEFTAHQMRATMQLEQKEKLL